MQPKLTVQGNVFIVRTLNIPKGTFQLTSRAECDASSMKNKNAKVKHISFGCYVPILLTFDKRAGRIGNLSRNFLFRQFPPTGAQE